MGKFSFRRSLRGSMAIIYIIALFASLSLLKLLGYEPHHWCEVVISILIALVIAAIDKQLPSRRWKNLSICLLLMGVVILSHVIRGFIVGDVPEGSNAWSVGAVICLAFGYGFYSLWRWRRCILRYRDIALQRELRARRRRKMVY